MERKNQNVTVKEAVYWVADVLMRDNKNFTDAEIDKNFILANYLIYMLKVSGKPQNLSLEQTLNELDLPDKVKVEAKERLRETFWGACMDRVHSYDAEVFKEIINNYNEYVKVNSNDSTPVSVATLAKNLLKIDSGECVADICCGTGNFLLQAADVKDTKCHGFEISSTAIERCQLRAAVNNKTLNVQQADVIDLLCTYGRSKVADQQFNKIFSQAPFGVKVKETIEKITEADLGEFGWLVKRTTSYCWLVAYLAMQMLASKGKVVIVTDNGACFNKADKAIREYFLDKGWLEAVISLPSRLFSETSISTTAIVLSRENKCVRMVNAEDLFQKGRRQNELTDANIFEILQRLSVDSKESMLVNKETIKENDVALSPNRYLSPVEDFANGIKLEQLVVRIKRSAPFTAKQMDNLNSEENTGLRCIRLVDIQNGTVQQNTPFMKPIKKKYDQYLLKDDDLIISKFGLPRRMAIVKVTPGEQWVMTGNMYALEFDKTKVNPYYVKAFFDSDMGEKALNSVTTDASVPVLSLDLLKTLQIPVPDMVEQNQVATKYLVAVEKVKQLKEQLQEAESELGKVFVVKSKK